MPRSLSDTQKQIVITLLQAKKPQEYIAKQASCSFRQVKRIKKNLAAFRTPNAPKLKIQGRPRELVQAMVDVIFFDTVLDVYFTDMCLGST